MLNFFSFVSLNFLFFDMILSRLDKKKCTKKDSTFVTIFGGEVKS